MGHYTYWLTADTPVDGALHYIGKRSCKGDPLDDSYMSSSDYVKQALASGINFSKQILSTWDTAEEALSHEILLHEIFDVGRNKLFFNKVRQTTTGFATASDPWNKGLRGAQEAWNKGLKGVQTAWNKGIKGVIKDTEETRTKKSLAQKGIACPQKGKPRTAEFKHNVSKRLSGVPQKAEHIQKRIAARLKTVALKKEVQYGNT